ncbi:IclR family transcriptional regulator [Pseudonocardia charpentierae]|uniref:IclR family transcriptional regulator n=1 Tax=Pseudonocardia charpentierae TaxID=3075545 RepID=A0ABU2N3U4_9PSEU|nr:IclR family transcriptional regulator [Pseudonocardia sp. DSM 45834]MDT0347969.1 IclR family transcriptional regulator [Pseudonocardia sp. DSM 45834]
MAGNTADPGRSVTSKIAAILTCFNSGSGHGLAELARCTGLPMSTAHRLTGELVNRGLLERNGDGRFRAGSVLQQLAADTPRLPALPTLPERAPFVVDDVANALRRLTRLGVLDDLQVAYIEKMPGHSPVTAFSVSARLPAHATALGKALLAFAPPDVTRTALASRLPGYTPRTVTRPDRLRRALAETRHHGYATDHGELDPQTCAVAVPVLGPGNVAIAAIEVQVDALTPHTLGEVAPTLTLAAHALGRELDPDSWRRSARPSRRHPSPPTTSPRHRPSTASEEWPPPQEAVHPHSGGFAVG